MYNNGYGAPEITNNPFINDPRTPQTRFPDLSTVSGGQSQWPQAPSSAGTQGFQQNGMYQAPMQMQQQPQPQLSPTGYLSSGIASHPTGATFRPTSSFGQQLAANISGTSYGYLQGQSGQQAQQQQQYHPVQQQLQSPSYVAQFDPYASIGNGWNGEVQSQNQMQQNNAAAGGLLSSPSTSTSPSGNPHPREYLRTHKSEIEAWDTFAWKQLLNAFDALKEAWEGRTKELTGKITQLQTQVQYGGGYYTQQIQQEGLRLQGLLKDAQSYFDSVAASSFQMHEVFQGYRQSSDLASKRRVREASNAAFQSLPDWPPQVY
ncbi:hypothetical protein DXG03_008615 [Asterophora parasitica]|uniref:Uncharacterized protein n=1 Tax=Asterophora parasitica TaxID=117018 RepID=A0A9P7G5D8_9AGAR|nr:hypothetical protein DXG03_008615 [Asterophora parasitica]